MNDVVIDQKNIEEKDNKGKNKRIGKNKKFNIKVENNLQEGKEYKIKIKVNDKVKNIGIQKKMKLDVREDYMEKDIKIDIKEGDDG